MREILFRGKRKDWEELTKEEWLVKGTPICFDDRAFIVPDLGINCIEDTETDKFIQLHSFEVIPETVCQYTGLNDKNGKKIFDGDIVVCKESECFGKIAWNDEEAGFYFCALLEDNVFEFEEEHIYDYVDEMEVIGNIYDNSELLEVQE